MNLFSNEDIIKQQVEKTFVELSAPDKPAQRSRVWKSLQGYRHLVQWSNTVLLRYLVRLFTASLPKAEYRRKAQLDDAARSTVRNIEEGWKRSNTSTYIEFISFSQGSLEEVKGDVRELTEDGFLPSRTGSSIAILGINLKDFNTALKPKGILKDTKGNITDNTGSFLYRPLTVLYPPLAKVRAQDLSYEIFMELINKTDYLFRGLVESLEKKLSTDQRAYQIEKLRIKRAIQKK